MKKFLPIAIAAVMAACNSSNTVTDEDTVVTETPDTTIAVVYTPVDGDVIYRDSKVYVMRDGQWVEAKDDVTLDNGVVIYKTGKARKGDVEIELKDGEMVNKSGDFFDRTGKAIDNAWQDTKEAVKDAGEAVGKTAKKIGKEIDTALDKDK